MEPTPTVELLDRVLRPITDCLNDEAAKRLAALQADPTVQARADELADRNTEGLLTPEERAEYELYVHVFELLSILKVRARAVLARSSNGG
jgi:hypothetical protein